MSWKAREQTLWVMVATVAVLLSGAVLLATWPPDTTPVAELSAGRSQDAPPERRQPLAVVLGDSFSAESPGQVTWPELLGDSFGWKIANEAVDGSGFVSTGQGVAIGSRVPGALRQAPELVIVAGGAVDLGAYPLSQIADAAEETVVQLVSDAPEAEIVLVSPFSRRAPGPLTLELNESLRRVAVKHQVPYVDATEWLGRRSLLADATHLSEAGHRRIASRMAQALRRQGIDVAVERHS